MSDYKVNAKVNLGWEAGIIAAAIISGFFCVMKSIDRWCDLEAAKAGMRRSTTEEKWIYDPSIQRPPQ